MNPTKRQKRIAQCWADWESIEPDISTEQLFERVKQDMNADEGEIVEALEACDMLEEKE